MAARPITCDFLVIGAGIAGSSLAFELASRGAAVMVVERGAVCSGSSALNAGGIRQQFSQETSVRAGMETVRRLATFAEDFGVDPSFRQAGYLFLHSGGRHERVLRQAVEVQQRCGVRSRLVGPQEVADLVPGINLEDVRGAAWNPTDGYVDPSSVVAGFAKGARRAGARIETESPLGALETSGGRVVGAVAGDLRLAPDVVVNTAGAWAPQVAALYGGTLPIAARRNEIFVLDQTPAPGRWLPLTIDLVTGQYFHSEGPGIVVGLAESFEVNRPGPEVTADWNLLPMLVERLVRRLPGLESAQVTHGWAGFIEPTPDDNPIVGWTHLENVYTMAGFSGHGMCLAPGLAPQVARELTGGASELDLGSYRLERFEGGTVEPEGVWGGTGISQGTAGEAEAQA